MLADRNEADGPLFKMPDEPRVTSIGRLLRKWSIDECPSSST
jgi:lipopolysaccharide/colanic/teichoic acid biosynthesis glycosyltransferase